MEWNGLCTVTGCVALDVTVLRANPLRRGQGVMVLRKHK